jgi:hypothetical protein
MSYLEAVIWLISWPVLIFATFQLIKYILKRVNYL